MILEDTHFGTIINYTEAPTVHWYVYARGPDGISSWINAEHDTPGAIMATRVRYHDEVMWFVDAKPVCHGSGR